MASNFMVNVDEKFKLEEMTDELVANYQAKGYNVRVLKMKKGVKIIFEKGVGGLNMIFGMGRAITATCMVTGKENDMLNVSFSDGDWAGKIAGCLIGWFLCFLPIITSIIGIFKQLSLPKEISNDIMMLASE